MKTSVHGIFAGSGMRLAVLSVLFLGLAGICMAQASAAPARPAAQTAVALQARPVAQTGRMPAPKGNHEGIKIHGHWTIEVRNPDGKLVTHREFENSLSPTEALLAQLLTGTGSMGYWLVDLATDSTLSTGPCGAGGVCLLAPSGSGAFTATTSGAGITAAYCAANGNCFSTLSVPVSNFNQVQLTGTATATGSGQIGFVTTSASDCITATGPVNGNVALSQVSPSACFAASPGSVLRFTSATLSTPVAVSTGQTVAVTVVLSFQ